MQFAHREPRKTPNRKQRKVLRKKVKFVMNEDMDVATLLSVAITRETQPSADGRDKLVIPVKSRLDAVDTLVSDCTLHYIYIGPQT